MRPPMMSGHCAFPETAHPKRSHQRCHDQGAGNTATPSREFAPCPCSCHVGEEYECQCGEMIYEAPMLGPDPDDGEMQYVHLTEDGLRIDLSGCP